MNKPATKHVIHFRRHQHLARRGEIQSAVYRLEDGWACRYRLLSDGRRQITGLFLPGEFCEPQWVLDGRALHPVVALTPLRVSTMPLDVGKQSPSGTEAVRSLLQATLNAIDRQAEWIVSLGCKTATERICELLFEIFERLRSSQRAKDNRCPMPLTQTDLADTVGLTPVHVNRVLGKLKAERLIELQGRRLRILDPEALRQAAAMPQR